MDPGFLNDFEHYLVAFDQDLFYAMQNLGLLARTQVIVFDLFVKRIPQNLTDRLSALHQDGVKLVGVDGLIDHRSDLDLIFIPSFRCPVASIPSGAPIVYGWDCFLLNIPVALEVWRPGNKVLVLTGGADVTGLGKIWPELLNDRLPSSAELAWVTGPFAQAPVWPEVPRVKMINHAAPKNLNALMAESQYAATVYGVSFFELLGHGIPTVVFSPYGDKDAEELAAIAVAGVALVATDEREATELLCSLMADEILAASLSKRAREKRLHAGSERFVAEMSSLLG
ncbi:hypothetical protein [Methylomonas rapida]|uniref:Glycosyltransferase family 1 protein n=1 Tax=Methylomonas rapida TaxID=2963939 RepID=A0ABY7GLN6_9GAMM|nr:hypothetical protein [Methylomonas rapida]WAR45410.1 hypothetical protein NM686_002555 [Methylomonas rapida]